MAAKAVAMPAQSIDTPSFDQNATRGIFAAFEHTQLPGRPNDSKCDPQTNSNVVSC